MKYFTKYLPVEGEIKELDYYHHLDHPNMLFRFYEPWDWKKKDAFKVKLFLCSTDIQVGDTLQAKDGSGTFTLIKATRVGFNGSIVYTNGKQNGMQIKGCVLHHQMSDWLKVIGEISEGALDYVTEGQEFDEYDYRYKDKKGWDIVKDISIISSQFRHLYFIGLKGPCGHFH